MQPCRCGRRSVLVVDDDDAIRSIVAELLAEEGCEVFTAADGADALNRLRRDHACLVLLDLMMPGLSGWQVFARLLEDENTVETPVCIISAMAAAAPARAAAVLHKPIKLEELLAVVGQYCVA